MTHIPMTNASFRSAIVRWLWICLASGAIFAQASPQPVPESVLEQHLRQLEKVFSEQLTPLFDAVSDGESQARRVRETTIFIHHLDALEPHLQALEPERADVLRRAMESLRERLQDLVVKGEPAPSETPPLASQVPRPVERPAAPSVGALKGPAPGNDDCGSAQAIGNGTFTGDLTMATSDGDTRCVSALPGRSTDVWFRYTAPADGAVTAYLTDDDSDMVVSVHAVCPGAPINEIDCDSRVVLFDAIAGSEVLIRVGSRSESGAGPFTLNLAPAARISGVVTDAGSGEPLSADVNFYSAINDSGVGGTTTDATGAYSFEVGPPGTYFVRAETDEHRTEFFDDVVCEVDCSQPTGTPIELAAGEAVEGIDFALDRLGSISGQVIDAVTGLPIPSVVVRALDNYGFPYRSGTTDDTGTYRIDRLKAEDYLTFTSASDYQDELYDDIPCMDPEYGDCELTAGTPVKVALNADTPGIDFALEPLGGVTGKVIHVATGEPLPLVNVILEDAEGSFAGSGMTDAAGDYAIGGVHPGLYFARTRNSAGFVDELFDDLPCPLRIGCEITEGSPIAVEINAVTSGIDFALELGGKLEGTITEAVTGDPLEDVFVSIKTADETTVLSTITDATGRYLADGLATGTFFVTVSRFSYVTEAFDDKPCPDEQYTCDLTTATPIAVAVGSTTRDIDFVLDRKGRITGTVTDLETGEPVPFASIDVWNEVGIYQYFDQANSSGQYFVGGLNPGIHFASIRSETHHDELYDGLPCPDGPPNGCDVTTGTPVEVELNHGTTVDFALTRRPMGAISGVVRGAAGEPIDRVDIDIYDASGNSVEFDSTDDDGRYEISSLIPGAHFVIARRRGFIGELYEGLPCRLGNCDPTAGTPVQVSDGSTTAGIDFTLTRLGAISGTVRDSLAGRPRWGSTVRLWDASGAFVDLEPGVNYSFEGLDPGTYFLTTSENEGFGEELYDNIPCPLSICDPLIGTPVMTDLDAPRSGVDFLLDLEQGITGRVTDELTGQPIPDVEVEVWSSVRRITTVLTGPTGVYVVPLSLGTYFVSTDSGSSPFDGTDEVYDDIPCQRNTCDRTGGTPVPVTGGAVTQNIDFALAPDIDVCMNTPEAVCLADDRFRVEVAWEDHVGNQGFGQASELTEATGTFWFFGADNIEIVVKVLDACIDPFNRFWVFAAGLTDVGVEITITDTLSGEVKTYSNPLGTPFAPIQDTAAFSTCLDDRDPATSPPSIEALTRELQQQLEAPFEPQMQFTGRAETNAQTCVPTATSLCLSNDRFRVESEWRTVEGVTGQGQAVRLSDATGFFSFFSDDNIEALVKVLDACIDPFNHFWVFAAGLTDVEVTLTVTDTESGEVKIYRNPLGTAFRPIQDTRAFDTCTDGLN